MAEPVPDDDGGDEQYAGDAGGDPNAHYVDDGGDQKHPDGDYEEPGTGDPQSPMPPDEGDDGAGAPDAKHYADDDGVAEGEDDGATPRPADGDDDADRADDGGASGAVDGDGDFSGGGAGAAAADGDGADGAADGDGDGIDPNAVARERDALDRQMSAHASPTGARFARGGDDDKQTSPRYADPNATAAASAPIGIGGGAGFNITLDRGAGASASSSSAAQRAAHAAYQKEAETYNASRRTAADAIAFGEARDDVSESDERNEQVLAAARAKRAALLKANREYQQKIWLWLHDAKRNKTQDSHAAGKGADQTVNREQMKEQYKKTLEQLNTLWNRIEQTAEESADQMLVLSADLKQADTKCRELNDAFKNFKRAIAREAKHSRNGKKIPFKEILHKETKEEEKDVLVAEVRIKNIQLSNKLKQLQDQVKQKEELEQGLHLIDFEQLKIENQTLTEKIEERNDELHKLRKKTTTTVQVLTHIKEKLHFVEEENTGLGSTLLGLEEGVSSLRDMTTRAKKLREKLRAENAELRQKQGFIGSDALVADFETRKGTLEQVREQVAFLKARHAKLTAVVQRAKQAEEAALQQLKARTRRPGLATVGAAGSLSQPVKK